MIKKSKAPGIYLAIILLFIYLPIIVVVIYSFNDNNIASIWGGFSVKNYKDLFADASIMRAVKNSLVLAAFSSATAGILGTLGAVGLSKLSFRGKGMLDYIITIPIMAPEIILGVAFFAFFILVSLPLGFASLYVAHTAFCIPYVYMMVRARLVGLDPSHIEAAKDLGATETRAFFDITLPALLPSVFSGMFLAFAMSMDDAVISNFLTSARFDTLPVKLYSQLKTTVSPKYNALGTLMLLVTVVLIALSIIIPKISIRKVEETK